MTLVCQRWYFALQVMVHCDTVTLRSYIVTLEAILLHLKLYCCSEICALCVGGGWERNTISTYFSILYWLVIVIRVLNFKLFVTIYYQYLKSLIKFPFEVDRIYLFQDISLEVILLDWKWYCTPKAIFNSGSDTITVKLLLEVVGIVTL